MAGRIRSDVATRNDSKPTKPVLSSGREERWELDSKVVELVALAGWMGSISAFVLMNNFVGPWPAWMSAIPERIHFTFHMISGMLFGGGIILTTSIEWLVAKNKNEAVLSFWFDKVPLLDSVIVLPALTVAMLSGIGLANARYGGLGMSPVHIRVVFWTLLAFAIWWAGTDLTTQGSALRAVDEWAASGAASQSADKKKIPDIVIKRTISNVVSCIFVLLLYSEMTLKPGTIHYSWLPF
jgi:hypothetical protein